MLAATDPGTLTPLVGASTHDCKGRNLTDNAKPADPRTPGRRARAASALGRSDLARRVARLPIPEDARARVARFVEDEVERARQAWHSHAAPLAGLQCPKCEKPIEDDLRKKLREDELLSVLRDVSADEAEKIIQQSRS